MSAGLAKKQGVHFEQSKVGEANVVDVMQLHNALYGGEEEQSKALIARAKQFIIAE